MDVVAETNKMENASSLAIIIQTSTEYSIAWK